MTDRELENKIKNGIGSICPPAESKARALSALRDRTGEDMNRKNIIISSAAETSNETMGKATVNRRSRYAAAAAAAVVVIGGGAFLMRSGDSPDTQEGRVVGAEVLAEGSDGQGEALAGGGYYVFDKLEGSTEAWRLKDGRFLIRSFNGDTEDGEPVYFYSLYYPEDGAVKTVYSSLMWQELTLYADGFSVSEMSYLSEGGNAAVSSDYLSYDGGKVTSWSFAANSPEDSVIGSVWYPEKEQLYTAVGTAGGLEIWCSSSMDDKLFATDESAVHYIDIGVSEEGGFVYWLKGTHSPDGEGIKYEIGYQFIDSEESYTCGDDLYVKGDIKAFERNGTVYLVTDYSLLAVTPTDGGEGIIDMRKLMPAESEYAPSGSYISDSGRYLIRTLKKPDGSTAAETIDLSEGGAERVSLIDLGGSYDISYQLTGNILFDEETGDLCIHGADGNVGVNVFGGEYNNFGIIGEKEPESERTDLPEFVMIQNNTSSFAYMPVFRSPEVVAKARELYDMIQSEYDGSSVKPENEDKDTVGDYGFNIYFSDGGIIRANYFDGYISCDGLYYTDEELIASSRAFFDELSSLAVQNGGEYGGYIFERINWYIAGEQKTKYFVTVDEETYQKADRIYDAREERDPIDAYVKDPEGTASLILSFSDGRSIYLFDGEEGMAIIDGEYYELGSELAGELRALAGEISGNGYAGDNDTAVTTTATAVLDDSTVADEMLIEVTVDAGDGEPRLCYISELTDGESYRTVMDWYSAFRKAGYEPSTMEDDGTEWSRYSLSFFDENGSRVTIETPDDTAHTIRVNGIDYDIGDAAEPLWAVWSEIREREVFVESD